MKPSQHLHKLIQALTPEEKRFVSRSLKSQKKGGKDLYLKLFQTIENQEVYEEEKVKAKFKNTSFGKSLAFPKSHLNRQLLQALERFHSSRSVLLSFRSELSQIDILLERGLAEQAGKMIEKALQKAEELENPVQMLELLALQRRATLRKQSDDYHLAIRAIRKKEEEWQQRLLLQKQAIALHDEAYAMLQEVRRKSNREYSPDRQRILESLHKLRDKPDLLFEGKAAVFRAFAHCYHMESDFREVNASLEKEIELWERHPQQIEVQGLRFVRAYGQNLSMKAMLNQHTELFQRIEELRTRDFKNLQEKAEIFQITNSLEMFAHLNKGNFSAIHPLEKEIESGLKKLGAYLSPSAHLVFFYNLAVSFWLGNKPGKALRWVNQVLQFESKGIRKDIHAFAPILEKILHWEMGNTGLLESWFRSYEYRKRRKNEANELETMLLNLIRTLLQTHKAQEQKQHFDQFLKELDAYEKLPDIAMLGVGELRIWAEGK